MSNHTARCLALALAGLTAGALPSLAKDSKDKKQNPANAPAQVGRVDATGTYQMSAEELTYDCKRLTGRMRIRLLEVRDYNVTKSASSMSQMMRGVTKPVVGVMLGSSQDYEVDPATRQRNNIAMLKAYNAQLVAKKCRPIDLDAELSTAAQMK